MPRDKKGFLPTYQSLFWYLACVASTTSFAIGTLLLSRSQISWPYSLIFVFVGVGGGVWLVMLALPSHVLSPDELVRLGKGVIVAKGPSLEGELHCSQCGKEIHTDPITQRDRLFCSEQCRQQTRTQLEGLKAYLSPPLSAKMMIQLLDEAIEFGKQTLRADAAQLPDQSLLLASHRGRGPGPKVERVALSLEVWNYPQWAESLRQYPPPELLPQGGYRGTPDFFRVALELQERIVVEKARFQEKFNPFAILKTDRSLDRRDIEGFQKSVSTASQKKAINHLHNLIEMLEERLIQEFPGIIED